MGTKTGSAWPQLRPASGPWSPRGCGGSFGRRDVMRLSGARMVEVGTTTRTRAEDYEAVVTPRTGALLRVHTSNFRVTGFTESAPLASLAEVAHRHDLLLIDDLGSG